MLFDFLGYVRRASTGLRPHGLVARKLPNRQSKRGWLSLADPADGESPPLVAPGSVFAMIGCQRTGTHLLRDVLNSNPCIAVREEPFSGGPHYMNWHKFAERAATNGYPPPLPSDAMVLFDQYIHAIKRDVREDSDSYGGPKRRLKFIGLDVKYEHIKCISPMYMDLQARPFLLDYFSKRRIRIVHLVRRNVVHTAISIIIANTRKMWQNYDGTVIQGRYRIPPDELFHYIRWVNAQREEFLRVAQDLPMQTCVYEDLVEDLNHVDASGLFRKDSKSLRALAAFLNVRNRFYYNRGAQKVINRPYAEILENYDELVRAVKDSEYSEFAGTL